MQNQRNLPRRALLAAALAFAAVTTQAQPNVIKVVVQYSAGGISDVIARAVVERMSRSLGQTMIIALPASAKGFAVASNVRSSSPAATSAAAADVDL